MMADSYLGKLFHEADYRSRELLLATNPLEPEQVVKIPKALIKAYRAKLRPLLCLRVF